MKLLKTISICGTLLILLSNFKAHEYYVSVTNVSYQEKQQSLQIISQLYIDDFENLLRERYDESVVLTTDNESDKVRIFMERYYEDKLKVKLNSEAKVLKYVGKEYEDDLVYTYLEIEDVSDITSIEIENQLLIDIYPEQQNIVKLKIKDKNKNFLLFKDKSNCMLNFD